MNLKNIFSTFCCSFLNHWVWLHSTHTSVAGDLSFAYTPSCSSELLVCLVWNDKFQELYCFSKLLRHKVSDAVRGIRDWNGAVSEDDSPNVSFSQVFEMQGSVKRLIQF